MSVTEILGFATGALSVWLAVKERVSNWPVGIANSAFFLVLFWTSALYANSILQVVYIVLGVYGWWAWLRGGPERTRLRIRHVRRVEGVVVVVLTAVATVALTMILDRFTNSPVPFWDGLTTALSLAATYMLTVKIFENWWVWIVTDVIYIPLYASQRLFLTSIVYALFLAMCLAGLRDWRRTLREGGRAPVIEGTIR